MPTRGFEALVGDFWLSVKNMTAEIRLNVRFIHPVIPAKAGIHLSVENRE
jgi:hypothetical protein